MISYPQILAYIQSFLSSNLPSKCPWIYVLANHLVSGWLAGSYPLQTLLLVYLYHQFPRYLNYSKIFKIFA